MSALTYFNLISEGWGLLLCITSSICAMMLILENPMMKYHFGHLFIDEALVLSSDMIGIYFDGRPGTLVHYIVLLSNTVLYISSMALLVRYTDYFEELVLKDTRWKIPVFRILRRVVFAEIGLVVVNVFVPLFFGVGSDNVYYRGPLFWLTQVTGILISFFIEIVLIRNQQKVTNSVFACVTLYNVLPIIAMIVQMCFYGLAILNICITFLLLVCFIAMMIETNRTIYNQQIELARTEAKLTENRTQLMISQIQPHFLYNALNSIYYLCGKDPKLAKKAIGDFSVYIRMNLDALQTKQNIPFAKELEHIRTYLWLEQLRFDERLQVEYDIQTTDFTIPVLTVQPMVENAVKHGVCRRPEGGTVWISTMDMGDYVQILVRDNGVGFDTKAPVPQDGRSHIGLQNVRRRLEDEIHGSLDIVSVVGEGTTVTITIPKASGTDSAQN